MEANRFRHGKFSRSITGLNYFPCLFILQERGIRFLNEEQLRKIKNQILKHEGCKRETGIFGVSKNELKDYKFNDIGRKFSNMSYDDNISWEAAQIVSIILLMFNAKYWADIFETIIIDNQIISNADKLSIFTMLYERTLIYCNSFKKCTFEKIRSIYQSTYDERIDEFMTDGYLILYRGISDNSAPLEIAHSYSLDKYYASTYGLRGRDGKLVVRRIRPNKIIIYANTKEKIFIQKRHVLAFYEDTEPLPSEYKILDPLEQYRINTESMKNVFKLIDKLKN